MSPEETRLECLRLAVETHKECRDRSILEICRVYEGFVTGGGDEEILSAALSFSQKAAKTHP